MNKLHQYYLHKLKSKLKYADSICHIQIELVDGIHQLSDAFHVLPRAHSQKTLRQKLKVC